MRGRDPRIPLRQAPCSLGKMAGTTGSPPTKSAGCPGPAMTSKWGNLSEMCSSSKNPAKADILTATFISARETSMSWLCRVSILALVALLPFASPASAQTWPTRPVTLVVPFAPGGGTDVLGRIIGRRLSEVLGQQVVIENVGGAGGMVGSARVAKARARRLPVRARQPRRRHQPDALQDAALQSAHRSRAGRADRRPADGAGRAQRPAGQQPARSSSPTPRRTRPRCSSARPAPARPAISTARCSTRRSASTSRTCRIAAAGRRCRT